MTNLLKAPQDQTAPVAKRIAHTQIHHNQTITDPYYWLKDQGYPDVTDENILSYLKEENAYFESVMSNHQALTDTLFEEIKSRMPDRDTGVPWREGQFDYKWEFAEGAQYRTWFYREAGDDLFASGGWQQLFDENEEADGKEYYRLAALDVSPDGQYLAFSADVDGSERFTLQVKNLKTGKLLDIEITETSGELVWNAASTGFYTVKVSKEWRPYLVQFHALSDETKDVFEETDTSFFLHIEEASSGKHMIMRSADHVTAEIHTLDLSASSAKPVCMTPRRTRHDYYVDHGEAGFYIRSNKDHKNFGIYLAADANIGEENWQPLSQGSNEQYIRGIKILRNQMIVQERLNGLDRIRVRCLQSGAEHYVDFPEDVCEASIGHNADYGQDYVRLTYTSMITPMSVFDYAFDNETLTLRKEQKVPSGYQRTDYACERVLVTARDGAAVPVSLVYKKDWQKNKGTPMHLYGYGAYGLSMAPAFSASRLSLLDRGFIYAIAHIRGGDEMGYHWYEDGKLKARENTFNDFVDCARGLVDLGYAASGEISISGGSAGGELMGAVLNQAPDLFKASVMHVPFVDVLNTMLDTSLPLTPIEWPEWGNPIEDAEAFDHIKSYCPYTNIAAKEYPPMMVTGGLNDPRVTYWEPAKWTAKMRHTKTDDNMLIMKINMGAGHGGKSGRFERYFEVAEEYCFLLMAFDKANEK